MKRWIIWVGMVVVVVVTSVSVVDRLFWYHGVNALLNGSAVAGYPPAHWIEVKQRDKSLIYRYSRLLELPFWPCYQEVSVPLDSSDPVAAQYRYAQSVVSRAKSE
jgi:hypothetical protein